jgi:ParB family chromosome partitioning protein
MNKDIKLPLPPIEDLFTTQEQRDDIKKERIETLPISLLSAFKSHPFKIIRNEDFNKLVDSIKENGVLIPAIARPKGDGYELIAGHRRRAACEALGIDIMPVLVREMTDEQAIITMVDSNVQRENVLPSEKAFAYKMKLEALNRQGQRADLTSTSVVSKSRTSEKVGLDAGDSREQVRRYIRLTELNPQLLEMVDTGKIAFRPAVELSYMSMEHQMLLLSVIDAEQLTPSLSQAQKLKTMSVEGTLDEHSITALMKEQKGNQQEQIKIPYEKVKSILKRDISVKEIEDIIFRAIVDYQRKLQRQQYLDAR